MKKVTDLVELVLSISPLIFSLVGSTLTETLLLHLQPTDLTC
jgi:hypothetical protein